MQAQAIVVSAVVLCCFCVTYGGSFVPDANQEIDVANGFLSGLSEKEVYEPGRRRRRPKHCHKVKGSAISAEFEASRDYLSALVDFGNFGRKNDPNAVLCVSDHFGKCSARFPKISKAWHGFLQERKGRSVAASSVTERENNFLFGQYDMTYRASQVRAVDVIISPRANASGVVYGRYHFTISDMRGVTVYNDEQASCGADENGYFVVGLNNDGLNGVRRWMNAGNVDFDLTLNTDTMSQISQDIRRNDYSESNLDIRPKIEAIVLYLDSTEESPYASTVFTGSNAHRRNRRSFRPGATDCGRKPYIVSFKHSRKVVTPDRADIGICHGSCDSARWPDEAVALNATGHAIKMLWNKFGRVKTFGNPEPKACCYPNAHARFHFLTYDERDNLLADVVDDMIAVSCACR